MLPTQLVKAIETSTVSHAYLFTDRAMAFEFASALGPRAVDFLKLQPSEGKVHILTDDVEKLQEEIRFKPFGDRRVVLIDGADTMQSGPQNKLLKTLEEPLGNTVFILYAQRRDALLPTVLSRCVEVASSDAQLLATDEAVKLASEFYRQKMAGAKFFELKQLLSVIIDDKEGGREFALSFLDAFENILRDELVRTLDSESLGKAIKLTEEARRNIKSSFSVAYAMKALALNISD